MIFHPTRMWKMCSAAAAAWIIAGIVVPLFVLPAAAQDERMAATLVASQEAGFGRMILTFKNRTLLPQYSAKTANGILKIEFQGSVDVDVNRVPIDLSDVISVARRDPDGHGIRFGLSRAVRVNTMEAGEKLFIDLLPSNWTGMPPGLPQDIVLDLARRAEKAMRIAREAETQRYGTRIQPRMELRVGRHPTFSRFVFAWNVPYDSAFVREDRVVTIGFNHIVEFDYSDIRAHLPPGVRDIARIVDEGGKMKVVIEVDPSADIRAFRDGQAYVVDVTPQKVAKSTDQGADKVAAAIDRALNPLKTDVTRTSEVQAPGQLRKPSAAENTEDSRRAALRKKVLKTKQPVRTSQRTVKQLPADAEEPTISPAAKTADSNSGKTPLAARSTADQPADPKDAKPRLGPLPKMAAKDKKPTRISPEAGARDLENSSVGMAHAAATVVGDSLRLAFHFNEDVAAAAFWRGRNFWLVFDTQLQIDLRTIRSRIDTLTHSVVHKSFGNWQTIRFEFKQQALTTVTREGTGWILSIGNTILQPAAPISINRVVRGDGGVVLRLPMVGVGGLHEMVDPIVGDTIWIATGMGSATGVIKPQSFVEIEILSSAHGIAAVSRADDLKASLDGETLVFARDSGLAITSGTSSSSEPPLPGEIKAKRGAFFDFRSLSTANPAEFRSQTDVLMNRLVAAKSDERKSRQIDMAKFYLAHRFAHETLGVLRLSAIDFPDLKRDPTFNILMGAALAMAARPKEARSYLARPELKESPDAAVWRTITEVQLRNWPTALKNVRRAHTVIGYYPLDLQSEFDLAGAHAAIESNDFGTAGKLLSEIDIDHADRSVVARFDLLRARIADIGGRSEEALTLYDNVMDSDDRPSAAEASYRSLRIRHRDGELETKDVAVELDRLTTLWRGDETELLALRFFAELSSQTGNYRRAFEAMKAAVYADANAETTRLTQDDMGAVFETLFLDGKANELPAVEALSLFYDFRELTPIGRRGDEIVRRLANRLVTVDLLGQAAELLRHQVDNRLKGAARAQIAADLAVIYMLDERPDLALVTIGKTRQAQLPTALERQRRLVEARAHSEIGKYDIAMEILKSLHGPDVDRLRADVLWTAKRWGKAGEALEVMYGGRWTSPEPLNTAEIVDILRAGIAYSLAGDDLGLDRLRSKYTTKLSQSPHSSAFEVVTRPIKAQGVEFETIARKIAAIDTMNQFLKDYRQQYLDAGLVEDEGAGANRQPNPT